MQHFLVAGEIHKKTVSENMKTTLETGICWNSNKYCVRMWNEFTHLRI